MLTPYQQLAQVRAATGINYRLDMFEVLQLVDIQDTMVQLWIQTYDYRTSGATATLRRRGTKVVTMTRRTGGRWGYDTPDIVWHPDFVVTVVRSDPPHTTAAERTEWEGLCARPGTPSWPMDSAARKAQGYW